MESTSSFCVWGKQKARKFKSCQALRPWNHQRTPFQQRLGTQMGTVFAACVADFFQNMARKLWIIRACFSGAFFVSVFWPGLTCAAGASIFGPKTWTSRRAKSTILTAIMSASLATSRAGALERFHECLLSGASAKNAARSSHAFKQKEVKQQADVRPQKRGKESVCKKTGRSMWMMPPNSSQRRFRNISLTKQFHFIHAASPHICVHRGPRPIGRDIIKFASTMALGQSSRNLRSNVWKTK